MNARDDMGAVPPGQGDVAAHAGALLRLACEGELRTWNLSGKELVPVVQGGMGVSVGGLAQRFFQRFRSRSGRVRARRRPHAACGRDQLPERQPAVCAAEVQAVPGHAGATAMPEMRRNENQRLRITGINVKLELGQAAADIEHLDRVLAQFEEFCTVSMSVRQCIASTCRCRTARVLSSKADRASGPVGKARPSARLNTVTTRPFALMQRTWRSMF